jgi:hypothetical protein
MTPEESPGGTESAPNKEVLQEQIAEAEERHRAAMDEYKRLQNEHVRMEIKPAFDPFSQAQKWRELHLHSADIGNALAKVRGLEYKLADLHAKLEAAQSS